MASWYDQSGWQDSSDSWFTKFLKGINWAFNYNHKWFDYDSMNSSINNHLGSFINSQTGAHMSNADVERNEMQMQNQEDIFQRQVSGMQKAGLNPALMYQSGVGSAPSAPAPTQAGMSMSDLMNAFLLTRQAKLLDAQTRNTDADTDKKASETTHMNLVNQAFPEVTATQIQEALSRMGVNDASVVKMMSEVNINDLQADLLSIEKIIKQAEADESSAYYKAYRELTEAQGDKAKAEKREALARAFVEEIEGKFMAKNGFKMSSAEALTIAAAVAHVFGTDLSSIAEIFKKSPYRGLFEDIFKDGTDGKGGHTSPTGGGSGSSGGGGR